MAPRAYYRTPCKVEVNDMLLKIYSRLLTLGITLILVAATVQAQETVYKWVDKDGVVHFSETPPAESESVEVETLTTAKPPLYVPPPVHPADQPSAPSDRVTERQSSGSKTGLPPPVAKTAKSLLRWSGRPIKKCDRDRGQITYLRLVPAN